MEWLEQNIDAYRIVSEILGQLRVAVREGLEQIYGEDWYRKGMPKEVFDRLVAAKEREKSIDWYEGQYQQIMDYVTFPDLIEILQMNADHFPEFMGLAPSQSLLNARFLELDVMRAKLGRARPISENELSFLGTFHVRFRKAVEESRTAKRAKAEDEPIPSEPDQEPEGQPGEISEVIVTEDADPKPERVQPVSPPKPKNEAAESSSPTRPVQTSIGSVATATGSSPVGAAEHDEGPTKEITPPEGVRSDAPVEEEGQEAQGDDDGSAALDPGKPIKAVGPQKLQEAMSNNDHPTVLRQLYREVTAIAEGVWTSEVTPAPLVWEQVTASEWYKMNFSRLGLQPLSVFYDVTEQVDTKVRSGADRSELQEFLKETNFAKTLLALRDMFQANNI